MRTRLTDLLEIEHPVMLAGMGGVSYHRLVAAVSEAGGFGTLGASSMPHEMLRAEMEQVRAATDRPFGVDLLTALSDDLEAQVRDIIAGGASVFVAALGVPREVIELCHEHGLLVINMCGRVGHAVAAVEAGCDIVVAQGTEAGGHTGRIATLPLVPQIVDAVGDRVPVVAAGGIVDGRGLAAALSLGAAGVWVGSRFIATPEARTIPGYKETLLESSADATTISRAYTGKTCRVIANDYTRYYDEHPDELQGFPMQIFKSVADGANHMATWSAEDDAFRDTGADVRDDDIDRSREFYPSGQGVGAITKLVPAGELVERFVRDAERILGEISSSVLV